MSRTMDCSEVKKKLGVKTTVQNYAKLLWTLGAFLHDCLINEGTEFYRKQIGRIFLLCNNPDRSLPFLRVNKDMFPFDCYLKFPTMF